MKRGDCYLGIDIGKLILGAGVSKFEVVSGTALGAGIWNWDLALEAGIWR